MSDERGDGGAVLLGEDDESLRDWFAGQALPSSADHAACDVAGQSRSDDTEPRRCLRATPTR